MKLVVRLENKGTARYLLFGDDEAAAEWVEQCGERVEVVDVEERESPCYCPVCNTMELVENFADAAEDEAPPIAIQIEGIMNGLGVGDADKQAIGGMLARYREAVRITLQFRDAIGHKVAALASLADKRVEN